MGGSVVVDGEGGQHLWFGGGLMTLKITSDDSEGRYLVVSDRMPKGKTTPLHLHAGFDETIYLVSGRMLVHIDGVEHDVAAGGVASIARGSAHAFLVTSDEAHVLVFVTPGDVSERFFREGGEVAASPTGEPPPLDIEKVKAAGERTGGMTVLGPPPFELSRVGR